MVRCLYKVREGAKFCLDFQSGGSRNVQLNESKNAQ